MNKSPQISPVKDNKQKQQNYKKLISNYNKAMKQGYYAEAELIVYAFLEDRLRTFIYYVGATNTWNSQKLNDEVISITGDYSSLNNMETKTVVLTKLFKAAKKQNINCTCTAKIRSNYTKNKIDELIDILKAIDKWRNFRNEITHALFNKDLDELKLSFEDHVKSGFENGRKIDNAINLLKRKRLTDENKTNFI